MVSVGEQFGSETQLGRKKFTQCLLQDIASLEHMLANDMIESDKTRIGAEQEICLVDEECKAAPLAMEVLENIDDPLIVNEFARFNLEINAEPQMFEGDCFSKVQQQIGEKLDIIREAAEPLGADVVLAGILPTLRQRDLKLENMTPLPRYAMLDENLRRMRGSDFTFSINGTDELLTRHASALLESCNTSFQVHLQTSASEFADKYNFTQLVSGPLLSACANSNLFFGKRLWRETRIALFQQSIDTRQGVQSIREQSPRVTFGKSWVKESVVEVFQDDLSRFRLLIHPDVEENSLQMIQSGEIPKLKALCLFNGTVYRWNRACYGISDGKPHLRIECRILPSGPTLVDEVANAAFWLGMVNGMPDNYRKLHEKIPFDLVHSNFYKAAKMGIDSQFFWLDNKVVSAQDLILEELLPMAREGLTKQGVDSEDRDRLLGTIEERVRRRHTGSLWMFESFNHLLKDSTRYEAATAITAAMVRNQREGLPVHDWPLASRDEVAPWLKKYLRIEQLMSTDLYTVNEHDLVDLAAHIMDWKRIRHVPVEDDQGQLVGLVTARSLMRRFSTNASETKLCPVADVMLRNPITIVPETSTLEALDIMRSKRVSCLPVVEEGKLVGLVTEFDFTAITAGLLRDLCTHSGSWDHNKEDALVAPT